MISNKTLNTIGPDARFWSKKPQFIHNKSEVQVYFSVILQKLKIQITNQEIIISRQTDWDDVVSKSHSLLSLYKRQIIFIGEEIVFWVNNFLGNFPFNMLMGFSCGGEVPLSHPHANLRYYKAENSTLDIWTFWRLFERGRHSWTELEWTCHPISWAMFR